MQLKLIEQLKEKLPEFSLEGNVFRHSPKGFFFQECWITLTIDANISIALNDESIDYLIVGRNEYVDGTWFYRPKEVDPADYLADTARDWCNDLYNRMYFFDSSAAQNGYILAKLIQTNDAEKFFWLLSKLEDEENFLAPAIKAIVQQKSPEIQRVMKNRKAATSLL